MNRIEFNMRLNALVSDFLEAGGCPSVLSEDLSSVGKEVFEDLVAVKQEGVKSVETVHTAG
jgi:hypothetical protein